MGWKSVGEGRWVLRGGCRAPWGTEGRGHEGDAERRRQGAGSRGRGQRREREDATKEGVPVLRSVMGRALTGQWDLQAQGCCPTAHPDSSLAECTETWWEEMEDKEPGPSSIPNWGSQQAHGWVPTPSLVHPGGLGCGKQGLGVPKGRLLWGWVGRGSLCIREGLHRCPGSVVETGIMSRRLYSLKAV